MKISITSEQIGHRLACSALTDFCTFLNKHIVSSSNKVELQIPTPGVGADGHYIIHISVEFALVPTDRFLDKKS